jgi:hypothetical protein
MIPTFVADTSIALELAWLYLHVLIMQKLCVYCGLKGKTNLKRIITMALVPFSKLFLLDRKLSI